MSFYVSLVTILCAEYRRRLGSSDDAFRSKYTNACETLTKLYHAIRQSQGNRRASKNGTPKERDEVSSGSDSDMN